MKKALVLRGFSYNENHVSRGPGWNPITYDLDFDKLYDNYMWFLQDEDWDIYWVSYDHPKVSNLERYFGPGKVLTEGNQLSTLNEALGLVKGDYDQIILTRFDLVWKMRYSELKIEEGCFSFPWREYEHLWLAHHRVGDAIHVFSGDILNEVRESFLTYTPPDGTLHFIWPHMMKNLGEFRLRFLFDGYYDTNPDNTREIGTNITNPLYYIWRGEFRSDL